MYWYFRSYLRCQFLFIFASKFLLLLYIIVTFLIVKLILFSLICHTFTTSFYFCIHHLVFQAWLFSFWFFVPSVPMMAMSRSHQSLFLKVYLYLECWLTFTDIYFFIDLNYFGYCDVGNFTICHEFRYK